MFSKFRLNVLFIFWSSVNQVSSADQVSAEGVHNEGRFVPPPPPLFPSILFPINAATGILVAIAVPITDLPYQNAFVSYNFEANYNMANIPADDFPGLLQLNGPTRVRLKFHCEVRKSERKEFRYNTHMTN